MHNPNIDMIQPEMMVHPSRNINLHEGGRGKRGGTAHVDTAAMSGGPRVMGIYDYRLKNGTQHLVRATADGKIYKDATTTIKTGLSLTKVTSFEYFNDTLYICNGADIPQTWDGSASSTSNLANIPSDWTGTSYPKQIIKHGRGASERLWAVGCQDTPHTVYVSKNGTDDFSDANVITINIDTGDGEGIIGAIEFGDQLICFGKRQAYIIDDVDTNTANWGYQRAQWLGGAANHRLIVETPYDLICFTEDGDIYSVVTAQSYGDYKAGSIARPAFIDRWIREFINLSYTDDFHAVYDPVLRAIKFFVVRSGQTQIDTALVYFIDRGPQEGWMVHDNQSYDSGYSASCSALIRVSTGDYQVYTGDYSGWIWKLEQSGRNDNGNGYYAGFRTPWLPFDNPRVTKHYKRGWGVVNAQGDYNLNINWWVDGSQQTAQMISLAGAGATLGTFTLNTDVLGGQELIDKEFDLGNKGKRISFEFYNSTVDQNFFMSQILVDHKFLGNRPAA